MIATTQMEWRDSGRWRCWSSVKRHSPRRDCERHAAPARQSVTRTGQPCICECTGILELAPTVSGCADSAHTRHRRPSSADAPSVSWRPGTPASTRAGGALAAVALPVSDMSDHDCRSLLRHSCSHSRPGSRAVTGPSRAVHGNQESGDLQADQPNSLLPGRLRIPVAVLRIPRVHEGFRV